MKRMLVLVGLFLFLGVQSSYAEMTVTPEARAFARAHGMEITVVNHVVKIGPFWQKGPTGKFTVADLTCPESDSTFSVVLCEGQIKVIQKVIDAPGQKVGLSVIGEKSHKNTFFLSPLGDHMVLDHCVMGTQSITKELPKR
ncbi:MAG: hypothetical protein HZA35_01665 [Parcubacteria group bacterium]|nr:hypothetical protein [Parcubacteria group bacterium]